MNRNGRKAIIAAAFDRAADRYDDHATLQRLVVQKLADRIVRLPLPAKPRILEIGCGTGLLARELRHRLDGAQWVLADLSQRMVARCREVLGDPPDCHFLAMDGELPGVAHVDGFDLICSSLATQWMVDIRAALVRWAGLLAPGGHIAYATVAAGSLGEWRDAHAALGLEHGILRFPEIRHLASIWPTGGDGIVETESIRRRHSDGEAFLFELRNLGAHVPAEGRQPLSPGDMRRLLRTFAAPKGIEVGWNIAFGGFRRFAAGRRGVFITGTDTDIGKTLVAACFARAWNATYWKPVQTGLATAAADSVTAAALAGLGAERVAPSAAAFAAPLSPHAAAAAEKRTLHVADIDLPPADGRPLVAEGAGGLLVPLDGTSYMIDLIAKLGLPAVLVARSTLGTINHTLLSLEALRRRHLPVAGVVMVGPPNPGNVEAIERFGQVRVIAEIPWLETADAAAVARLAGETIPPIDQVLP